MTQSKEPEHNHTPWVEYRNSLTTGGYSIEWVNEVMDGLRSTWACPACSSSVSEGHPPQLEEESKELDTLEAILEAYSDIRYPNETDYDRMVDALKELISNKERESAENLELARLRGYEKAVIDMEAANKEREADENTSDGYHTFKELYQYRMLYNAALFNEWTVTGKHDVHMSFKHSDGEYCFGGGWFVVVAQLPTGQITNHYKQEDIGLFSNVDQRERAAEWDGHTPQDVAKRLRDYLTGVNHKRGGKE